jgi:molecular chaperone DnaK
MVREAEEMSDRDRERKELAEARNQADHSLYTAEKLLRENGDKVTGRNKESVERALEALKRAKDSNSSDEIRRGIANLQTASQEFSKQLYEAATAKPQEPPAAGPGENVVDAEFKTKDNK